MGIKLIKVKSRHNKILKNILDKCENEPPRRRNKRTYNLKYKNRYLICFNGTIVGTISVNRKENPKHIWSFYIIDKYRNKRIGSSVISMLIKNNNKYTIGVNRDNIMAKKLYERFGFSDMYPEDSDSKIIWMSNSEAVR